MDIPNYLIGGYKEPMGYILHKQNAGGGGGGGSTTWDQFVKLCEPYTSDVYVGQIASGVINNKATIESILTNNGKTIADYTTIFAWKYDNNNWQIYFSTNTGYSYQYQVKVGGVWQKISMSGMSGSQMIKSPSWAYTASTASTLYTDRYFIGIFTKNGSGTLPSGCVAVVNE